MDISPAASTAKRLIFALTADCSQGCWVEKGLYICPTLNADGELNWSVGGARCLYPQLNRTVQPNKFLGLSALNWTPLPAQYSSS